MHLHVFDNEIQAGRAAATLIAAQILQKPDSVLGLATGSTPLPAYRELVQMTLQGILDWNQVTTFNLDEYIGLPADHEQSYRSYMQKNLFAEVNLKAGATHLPDGMAADLYQECLSYERKIRQAGGIDLQLLGLGRNGHIGFNEPDSLFSTRTRVIELTADTLDANARFFKDQATVPRKALSMGIGTIMLAKKIILLVTGAQKTVAIRDLICEDVNPQCPGSVLQLHHDVIVLLDRAAAASLNRC